MIEKESCPLCNVEDRAECQNCEGSGEVEVPPIGTKAEGAIYNLFCACGDAETVVFTEEFGPLDLEQLQQKKCPRCGEQFQNEVVGWGSTES